MNKFEKLGLSEELLKAINELGFEKPTPIQENIIPVILEGYDVIGQAQTGTGKTLAFSSILLTNLKERKKKPAFVKCRLLLTIFKGYQGAGHL